MTAALFGVLLFTALLLLRPGITARKYPSSTSPAPSIRAEGTPRGPEGGDGPDPALQLDLLGAMLATGVSLPQAVAMLARSTGGKQQLALEQVSAALLLGLDWHESWALGERDAELDVLRDALTFGAATGAPSAAVLFAQADQVRRRRRQEDQRRAAALGTKLVLPLGLCALPAFMALGVVPVLASLLPQW